MRTRKTPHELVVFLVLWAERYAREGGINGLHPTHYDLMVKYGCRMDDFKRATTPEEAQAAKDKAA